MPHDVWELRQKQSLPLKAKVIMSLNRIRQWYDAYDGKVYVSFSGGKDSTVLLDLVRSLYPEVPAVFSDTGLEYPEIREFVRTIPNVIWVRPEMTFKEVLTVHGFPVISKDVARTIYYAKRGSNWANQKIQGINKDGTYSKWKATHYKQWAFLKDSPFLISDNCCSVMKKKSLWINFRSNLV